MKSLRRSKVDLMAKSFENYADFASYLRIPAPFDGSVTEKKDPRGQLRWSGQYRCLSANLQIETAGSLAYRRSSPTK